MNAQVNPDTDLGYASFEPMSLDDLEEVVAIEVTLYSAPWTLGNFRDSLAAHYSSWVMRKVPDSGGKGDLLGYFLLMAAVDDAHLLNLSVAKPFQKRGYGLALLQKTVEVARVHRARNLMLEVRPSNLRALGVYQRYGFRQIGLRSLYYPTNEAPHAGATREDALVMHFPFMTETFRRRALAEMGLAPWVPRLALLKDESAETVSLATVPKRGGADLEVINPGSTARLPIGPLTALNLPDLLPLMQGCSACDRVDTRRLVALPRGSAKARLMVIEQAPGPEPLNGDRASTANVQRLFEQMLFSLGLSVLEVYISHMVRCDGELPSEDQIATCSAYLKREIELIEPRAILAFEPLAEKAVRQFGISCEVLTLPHPRTLLGNGGSKKAAWLKLLELKSLLAQGED